MYPAEKLIAEIKTTTPALMTQVIIVGLTGAVESETLTRRLFLDAALRSFGETDRRLTLLGGTDGATEERGCLRRGGPTEGLVSVYRLEDGSSPLSSPIAMDSPTSRNEDGGTAFEGPARNDW